MSRCKLADAAEAAIAALGPLTELTALDLYWNHVSVEGRATVVSITGLQLVRFEEDVAECADLLTQLSALTSLDLLLCLL